MAITISAFASDEKISLSLRRLPFFFWTFFLRAGRHALSRPAVVPSRRGVAGSSREQPARHRRSRRAGGPAADRDLTRLGGGSAH